LEELPFKAMYFAASKSRQNFVKGNNMLGETAGCFQEGPSESIQKA